MSSVWKKEVNNVFVHHECECTRWRYSKKNTKYSKANNERVHIEYGLWISSTALRSWISETQEKKKKKKKENRKNLH